MKILYFDCFSGISGNMTLAALIDLGINPVYLTNELDKLHLGGWKFKISEVSRNGIQAKHLEVLLEDEAKPSPSPFKWLPGYRHPEAAAHRSMSEIARIIHNSGINEKAKEIALAIFHRLATAEAKIHGTTPDEVHFHEVGAVDSILDIVGTAICIDLLAPDRIYASVVHDGHGFVKCRHGLIPIPVPAVTEVLAERGVALKQIDVEGELVTPTGAAILSALAESFGVMPEMKLVKIAYGAGSKDYGIPNLLRLVCGESLPQSAEKEEEAILVLETNIDDSTPQVLGYVMEKLLEAGALDVFLTPIYMKKNRPATLLTLLCDEAKIPELEHILFSETSTIGLRKYLVQRTCLPRKTGSVTTPYGNVKAKEIRHNGQARISLEYEDACRLAREKQIPLRWILES
ncbi:MAG: nickel pincer cofactor biosynthesis protein LarC [Tannerellaceae bacterium]|jgi:uncharacterized protein (TIGR00299 family) protein|nr:nickel pincer cofactor biosynthesis protein LarC [Tannerellaceae bacterium]